MKLSLLSLVIKFVSGGLKRRLWGCCLLVFLALILACGLILGLSFFLGNLAAAQEAPQEVLLLIDNSNSMFEKNGIGTDPEQLRIQAAQLFMTYLGVDSGGSAHRLGVIFFGGEAELAIPLTPLTDSERRAELARLIENPGRMAWTNPQAALELALATFSATGTTAATHRAVVLLTDGKPEWTTNPTPEEKATINARLKETAGRFAAAGIPLFIILLQNEATDVDPEIEQVYAPLWQALAAATPPGRFYRARQSEALLDIYHDIMVTLTRRQTAGVVIQRQVETQMVETIMVEPGLAQITLVIRKSDPAIQVALTDPAGRRLRPGEAGVQYGGQPGQSLEEIWAIANPAPGRWQARLSGQGTVTVWKDFYPAPATATFTPNPTSTATLTPVPSPTPRPTSAPRPTPTLTATPLPPAPAKPTLAPTATGPPPAGPSRQPPSWWLGLPLLALGLGGGWLWFRARQAGPFLSGVVRLLSGSNPRVPAWLDLDSQNRRALLIGSSPAAGLYLPVVPAGPPVPTVWLVARLGPDDEPEVALVVAEAEAHDAVQVNNLPVSQEWGLKDGDVLSLGPYRFKYENLRQRGSPSTGSGFGAREQGSRGEKMRLPPLPTLTTQA